MPPDGRTGKGGAGTRARIQRAAAQLGGKNPSGDFTALTITLKAKKPTARTEIRFDRSGIFEARAVRLGFSVTGTVTDGVVAVD